MIFRALFASSLLASAISSVACSSSTPTSATPGTDASTPVADGSPPINSGDAAGATPTTDGGNGAGDDGAPGVSDDGGPDLDMQAADFECILRWAKVGDYRITNKLVDAGASIAVGDADGGIFPIGTIIQLIPNEAIVKRRTGFNPANDDWEFFNLSTSSSGTVINQRGGTEVTNASGSCAGCHEKAAAQYDFVCGTTHGCAPLPFTESEIQAVQNGDPRCP